MKMLLFFFLVLPIASCSAQNMKSLPFAEIPDAPEEYTSATMLARMVDGLGYRYYWATEALTQEDLEYKPSAEGRTIFETAEHIYGLSQGVANTITSNSTALNAFEENLPFEEKRSRTLHNLKVASDFLRAHPDLDFSEKNVIFRNGGDPTDYPFWNLLNGPLEDALWHTGQIVVLRRSAGNPLPKGVNVFIGKTKQ